MTAAETPASAPPRPDHRAAAEEASAFGHDPVPPAAAAAYGTHPDQVIDFYRPPAAGPGARPAPLVALVHGGAWRAAYDRAHLSPLAAHLAGQGFAVASVEYRRGGPAEQRAHNGSGLPPAGRWPDTFDDIAAAVDALPRLAVDTLGERTVDPRRIVLTGHSAGGHLVLWAAARHVLPAESLWHRPAPPPLRGVVALAPIADLTAAIRLRVCSGAVFDLLGGPGRVEGVTDRVTERLPHADPAALLPTGIATTIVHGTTDNVVPPQVSEAFVRAAGAAGEEPTVAWLAGTGHFPLIDPVGPACATVLDEIAQLAW